MLLPTQCLLLTFPCAASNAITSYEIQPTSELDDDPMLQPLHLEQLEQHLTTSRDSSRAGARGHGGKHKERDRSGQARGAVKDGDDVQLVVGGAGDQEPWGTRYAARSMLEKGQWQLQMVHQGGAPDKAAALSPEAAAANIKVTSLELGEYPFLRVRQVTVSSRRDCTNHKWGVPERGNNTNCLVLEYLARLCFKVQQDAERSWAYR